MTKQEAPMYKIDEDLTKTWSINGVYHREDGPAVIMADGTEHWYLCGSRHRVGGPASIYSDGSEYWSIHDKLHRTDGPAVRYPNGDQYRHLWYIDGKRIYEQSHYQRLARLTDEEMTFLILKYGALS